jgi:hypothetical protein
MVCLRGWYAKTGWSGREPAQLHAGMAAVAGVVGDGDLAQGRMDSWWYSAGWLVFTSSR